MNSRHGCGLLFRARVAKCLTCESWGRYHCGEHSGRPVPTPSGRPSAASWFTLVAVGWAAVVGTVGGVLVGLWFR